MHGFTNQRLGKIPTSSPTASRRSRQIVMTLAASLGFQTHKRDVKCACLQSDLDEQNLDDNDDDFKIESAQSVSDTFCEPTPKLSRKLQLDHNQCVRLLKAAYGLISAPRRRSRRVAPTFETREAKNLSWNFACGLRNENGVIQALCLVYVDDFTLACSASTFRKQVFDGINNLYEWGTWESRVFRQCGARTTQANDKHTNTWGGFEMSFTEYEKRNLGLQLAITSTPRQKIPNHST